MADHNRSITINIDLDGAPTTVTGFGTALLLYESATMHDATDRVRAYASVADAEADATLPAPALAAIVTAFSQPRPPSLIKVGRKVPSTETWPEALAAVRLVDDAWYGLAISSRASADLEAVSAAVEALPKIAFVQSNDATLLTSSIDAALADIFARERSAVVYHSADAQWADVAWPVNRLAFDPDTISAPWDCELGGVTAPAELTPGQYAQGLANHVNIIAALDGASTYLDQGVNAKGRPLYEILTADWFEARLRERVSALRVELSRRGQKLILNQAAGASLAQSYLINICGGLAQEGVSASHFVEEEAAGFTAIPITSTDLNLRRVRVRGQQRFAVSGVLFDFSINFTRNALSAA